jgi:GNAT superfamily N-acetyltransferase
MQISFRKASIEDIQSICDIGTDSFAKTFIIENDSSGRNELIRSYLKENYRCDVIQNEMLDPLNEYHLLLLDNRAIGFAKLVHAECPFADSSFNSENTFQLERFYLYYNIIGTGYGRKFFDYILEIFRAKGAKRIWLGVFEKNFRALRFYEKNGFQRLGPSEFRYTDDANSIVDLDYIYHLVI